MDLRWGTHTHAEQSHTAPPAAPPPRPFGRREKTNNKTTARKTTVSFEQAPVVLLPKAKKRHLTSLEVSPTPGKIKFVEMVGAKRRRMSGGNSSKASDSQNELGMETEDDEKTTQTSKCKGATTIPIFLKSEYSLSDQSINLVSKVFVVLNGF